MGLAPNIMNEGLLALIGRLFSEMLNHHLDVLHKAREAFTVSENSDQIQRALRRKICTKNAVYNNGDLVWYRKRDHDRDMDPGKVIFQDGKVIFVRHGSQFIRLSANRIVRREMKFKGK